MIIQFKITPEQTKSLLDKYPVYFGGDMRDVVGKLVNTHFGSGCRDNLEVSEEDIYDFVATVDTKGKYVQIEQLENISLEVSEVKIIEINTIKLIFHWN